jgi:hypothetical protein
MLAAHNSKFKKSVAYEPRRHSVRDVKQWEARTGKRYASLSMAERAKANDEIQSHRDASKP